MRLRMPDLDSVQYFLLLGSAALYTAIGWLGVRLVGLTLFDWSIPELYQNDQPGPVDDLLRIGRYWLNCWPWVLTAVVVTFLVAILVANIRQFLMNRR
jgi:hypothetical protein